MKLSKKSNFQICLALMLIMGNSIADQDLIIANDGKAGDYFGFSAAIDGKTVLVGSNRADVDGVIDAGAAYVFVLQDTGWQQQAKLVAKPAFADDRLGGNVALYKNNAMLGVMRRDDKGKDSGAVVSFERKKNSWTQNQIFTAPDAKPGDAFGQSIALTKNHLIIGAPRSDSLGIDSGAAYIYKRDNGIWRFQTKIKANDGIAGDLFGISVAIDGDTILVGADLHDAKAKDAGAVYVFVLSEESWSQEAKLMALDGGEIDIFGVRVALSGNTALISARRDDIEEIGTDAGSAYIFERNEGVWAQTIKLTSPDGLADDRFGRGVALSDNMAIISAMNHDANGSNTGAVYAYIKDAGVWQYTSKFMASSSHPEDRFGWNLGLSGDFAVIATPHHDARGKESGAVFIQDLDSIPDE